MPAFAVVHKIHVHTPHKHKPQLFVTDVPEGESVDWELVEEGYSFGEFGVKRGNHYITKVDSDAPASVKKTWRNDAPHVERVPYSHLKNLQDGEGLPA